MPKLHIHLPDGSTHDQELTDDLVTIGRIVDNMIQIEDASVSSHHAQLVFAETGDYILQDLGSTNGTRLNGKTINEGEQHKLQNGDKVRFGSIEAIYGSENAAEAREEMPEAAEPVQKSAAKSVKPSGFMNASPFQKKSKKKDPAAMAVWAIAAVALIALVAATVVALDLQSK
jgi:pSer/pThr/pTyr-binding forkhead associated (FHA) protein